MKFSQVRLLVDDPSAAFRFFRDELGLAPTFGEEAEVYASFDADVARLGSRIVAEPIDRPEWGGRVTYLRDPSGNLIELFQSIPTSE